MAEHLKETSSDQEASCRESDSASTHTELEQVPEDEEEVPELQLPFSPIEWPSTFLPTDLELGDFELTKLTSE